MVPMEPPPGDASLSTKVAPVHTLTSRDFSRVFFSVCPVTRLVNLQEIEGEDASCILEGITRLSCEIGVPKFLMIDGDDTIKKA